jgi:hypothetical protein
MGGTLQLFFTVYYGIDTRSLKRSIPKFLAQLATTYLTVVKRCITKSKASRKTTRGYFNTTSCTNLFLHSQTICYNKRNQTLHQTKLVATSNETNRYFETTVSATPNDSNRYSKRPIKAGLIKNYKE